MLGETLRHPKSVPSEALNALTIIADKHLNLKTKDSMTSFKCGIIAIGWLILFGNASIAQNQIRNTELEQITATLMDYIDGTANGEPDRLRKAFHKDFNLYTVNDADSLRIRSGEQYISNIKQGEKSNRICRIISIDYEKENLFPFQMN